MTKEREIVVTVNGLGHEICNHPCNKLTLTQKHGWQLWAVYNGIETLMGGEYSSKTFKIVRYGRTICEKTEGDEHNV